MKAFELDHLFICSEVGAPEAEYLRDFGLIEGPANVHPGQGTANRRFFFHNAMLELLWVDDPVAAQNTRTRPTHLWERWQGRRGDASPFGICLRPRHAETATLPFPAWAYQPTYLPAPRVIHMGANSAVIAEPLLFYLAFGQRPDTGGARYPMTHAHRIPGDHGAAATGSAAGALVASPPGDGAERDDDMVCRFAAPYGDWL